MSALILALAVPGIVAAGTASVPDNVPRLESRLVATAPPEPDPPAAVSAPPLVLPPVPTRASVREQIERIDPSQWLRRYGPVERRELR